MKVLITTNVPSPYRVDFFNELGKHCDLTVTFQKYTSSERDKSWKNYKFENFKAVFLKGFSIKTDQAFCFGYKKLLNNNYDVILSMDCGTPSGALFANYMAKKGIPFFIETDGCFYIEPKTFKQKLRFKIKKKFYEKAVGCFASCYNSRKTFLSLGVKEDRIINYSFTSLFEKDLLSVPLSDKEKQEYKSGLGITESKAVITVGRFSYLNGYGKGFDAIMQAAPKLRDIGFYIIGDSPTEEFLSMQKELNATNVHFVSYQDKNGLKKYYGAADIFVLMTVKDIWGLVINEAMANALPIITTDMCVAGIELVKNDENGFILPVGDYCALAEKINEIVNDDEKRIAFSERSLEKIRAYTIENMVNEHLDAFKRLQSKGNN